MDISAWSTPFDAAKAIEKSSLDFDDDLYFYRLQENKADIDKTSIQMWEYYEIHPSIPRKVLSFGVWTSTGGLKEPQESKFERRKNFEV